MANLQVRKGGLPPLERQLRDWLGNISTGISPGAEKVF